VPLLSSTADGLPTAYAVYLAFTNDHGQFVGLGQFTRVVGDFRFGPAFAHIGVYLVMWLLLVIVLTVVTAVILRSRVRPGLSSTLRFLYYLPGALAGVASAWKWPNDNANCTNSANSARRAPLLMFERNHFMSQASAPGPAAVPGPDVIL